MREIKIGLLAALLGLAVTACEPANNAGGKSGDGRQRLNVNNSTGKFSDYVIHINAMSSADLTPEVAQSYGVTRSTNSGFVNLVVLQKSAETGVEKPVKAQVELSAANLTGQLKSMDIREVTDGPSIYYIGEVGIDDEEMINFDFDVVPAGSKRKLLLRFSHQFYTR